MKKGIEVRSDYDRSGKHCLRISKAKGKFSLDEIIDAAREYEEDIYVIAIKAVSEENSSYFPEIDNGDFVTLYRATDFFEKGE